tara:strand:- start:2280 stop:2456 length:177 start_codon:yes stop_codon:yes gene_type:complete
MKLEDVQIALFAAYDLSNSMIVMGLGSRPTENDTFEESIAVIIDFLISLETQIVKETK